MRSDRIKGTFASRVAPDAQHLPARDVSMLAKNFPGELLHTAIIGKCEKMFGSQHYAQAVEWSFKVVRDRLRELTGHETGSKAFGDGKLHVRGAAAPYVDADFNQGVKFLTMAIDMFRNEKAHTSEIGVDDPQK